MMPLSEGQVSVRNLVMGAGTNFRMMNDFNPFIRHVRAEQSGPRAWGHGSWSGVEWSAEAVVPMRILIEAADTTAWLAAQQQLAAAFRPIGEDVEDVELRFSLGGREYLMFGRPRMVEPDMSLIGRSKSFSQAAFVALDPTIYDGAEQLHDDITLPTFIGGLTVPLTAPFTVDGTVVGGFVDLTNEGTKDAGMLLRIDAKNAPLVEPRVVLKRDDGIIQVLRFDVTLAPDQWLDVDTAARTVLLQGTHSLRGQTTGEFPLLPGPEGTHRLEFRSSEENNEARLTVRFRSAWW